MNNIITLSEEVIMEPPTIDTAINMIKDNSSNHPKVDNTMILEDTNSEITDLMNLPDAVDIDDLQFICSADEQMISSIVSSKGAHSFIINGTA